MCSSKARPAWLIFSIYNSDSNDLIGIVSRVQEYRFIGKSSRVQIYWSPNGY